MVDGQALLVIQPKNLICNFRAPNREEFQRWKAYVQWAKDNGMDVCRLTLSLTDSFIYMFTFFELVQYSPYVQ